MKKLLLILLCLPFIGFGQGDKYLNLIDLPNQKEETLDTSIFQLNIIDTAFKEEINKSAVMSLPYPIIFIHGLNGHGDSWKEICTFYNSHCNWSWGGEIEFCLEMYDSPGIIQDMCDLSLDVNCFTSSVGAHDYYRIEFDCMGNGDCHSGSAFGNVSNWNSNQAAVIKQGKAIGIAIDKVLNATGKGKVILVGHSMGGLAAREYIQNSIHWLTGNHRVAKLVTSGTPHQGSNYSGFGGGVFLHYDEESEAVRDLRSWYYYSLDDGVYLWDGLEYQNGSTHMDDNFNFSNQDFHNVDVNCNGVILDNITGLNNKSIPTDIDYACIYGTEDDVVENWSSNLYNVYSYLTRLELMTCNDCNHALWSLTASTALTSDDLEPLYRTFKALDEPDYLDLAYKVEVGSGYNFGYLTFQSPNHPNPNIDDDAYYFYNSTFSNTLVQFNDLPANSLLSIYNSSSSSVPISSTYSSNGSASLIFNNITPGYYYLKISASPYNYPNPGNPTPWDNPYKFYISSSVISSTIEDKLENKKLIEIKDLLGRDSQVIKNRTLFYIYDDGTVEKRIIIE